MTTAAIYARVSSERQKEEHTIRSQVAALMAYATERAWTVPAEWVFEDEGYSGASLVRPSLERLRDLASEGLIERVLVYSPDRLSRKYAFALAQEQLEKNRRYAPRRTIEATLLQSILVCKECGYAYYRTSTQTSKRKLYYYRCLGSDDYRYPNGRLCTNQPIRQGYLDELVRRHVLGLLEDPELIRAEIRRRIEAAHQTAPTQRRKDAILKELARVQNGIEKLFDAYQDGLLMLPELRKRVPKLRKHQNCRA